MRIKAKVFFSLILLIILLAAAAVLILEKKSGQPQGKIPVANLPAENSPKVSSSASNDSIVQLNDSSRNIPLPGKMIEDSALRDKYGKYAYEAFQKNPSLVDKVKAIDPNFDILQMDPSFPSRIFQLETGKEYLAFSGCTAHNCGGTEIMAIYDEKSGELYLGKENPAETQLQLFGSPPEEEKNILLYYYFNK